MTLGAAARRTEPRKRSIEEVKMADENAVNQVESGMMNLGKGLKEGPRRAILGETTNQSNPTNKPLGMNTQPSITIPEQGSTRNLRAKTIQATMATRAKTALAPVSVNVPSTGVVGVVGDNAARKSTAQTQAPTAPFPNDDKWEDLDAEDANDPLMVSEYVNEIIDYMRSLETKIAPLPSYIDSQKELNWSMRSILVDWLVEVQWKLKLLPETLFLTVNLIDRFLSRRAVSMVKLQLVGLTATMIAAKTEEVLSPSVANFIYLSDNAYDTQELLKAERYMLHVLDYGISYPSPLTFLRRISKAEGYDVRTRTLAKYLMETALLDERFLSCLPSVLAAMGIFLARHMLSCGSWNANLRHYSGYAVEEMQPWMDRMLAFLQQPLQHRSIYKKYTSKKLMKASIFVESWIRRTYPECAAAQAPVNSSENSS